MFFIKNTWFWSLCRCRFPLFSLLHFFQLIANDNLILIDASFDNLSTNKIYLGFMLMITLTFSLSLLLPVALKLLTFQLILYGNNTNIVILPALCFKSHRKSVTCSGCAECGCYACLFLHKLHKYYININPNIFLITPLIRSLMFWSEKHTKPLPSALMSKWWNRHAGIL